MQRSTVQQQNQKQCGLASSSHQPYLVALLQVLKLFLEGCLLPYHH